VSIKATYGSFSSKRLMFCAFSYTHDRFAFSQSGKKHNFLMRIHIMSMVLALKVFKDSMYEERATHSRDLLLPFKLYLSWNSLCFLLLRFEKKDMFLAAKYSLMLPLPL